MGKKGWKVGGKERGERRQGEEDEASNAKGMQEIVSRVSVFLFSSDLFYFPVC